jgi:hypothetical protein
MRALFVAATLHALVLAPVSAQGRPARLDAFLTGTIGLDAGQLAALAKGEVVARVLPTGDDRDVLVFAAAHISAPRDTFLHQQTDPSRALLTTTRRAVHVFSAPARPSDVADIDVTRKDIDELQKCRPNECNFKLPSATMDSLRTTVDWNAPDASARVTAFVRSRILRYVADYRARGDEALITYDDNGHVRASDALTSLVDDSSYTPSGLTALRAHLVSYPHDALVGAREVIFWSLDELPHVRPILRITHQTVYSPPELTGTTIVAAKQIFADHYFEAGFELLVATDDSTTSPSAAPTGFTCVALRRYRFDHLPRGGLLNLRGRVIDGLRDNVRADLLRLAADSR